MGVGSVPTHHVEIPVSSKHDARSVGCPRRMEIPDRALGDRAIRELRDCPAGDVHLIDGEALGTFLACIEHYFCAVGRPRETPDEGEPRESQSWLCGWSLLAHNEDGFGDHRTGTADPRPGELGAVWRPRRGSVAEALGRAAVRQLLQS